MGVHEYRNALSEMKTMSEGRRRVLIQVVIEPLDEKTRPYPTKKTRYPLPLPGIGIAAGRLHSAKDSAIRKLRNLGVNTGHPGRLTERAG